MGVAGRNGGFGRGRCSRCRAGGGFASSHGGCACGIGRGRWGIAHGVEDFGGDDDFFAGGGEVFEGAAGDFFAGALGVHVGGVEEVDAGLDGAAVEGAGLVFVEDPVAPFAGAVGHGAEADAGDFEAGAAEVGVLHTIRKLNHGLHGWARMKRENH